MLKNTMSPEREVACAQAHNIQKILHRQFQGQKYKPLTSTTALSKLKTNKQNKFWFINIIL